MTKALIEVFTESSYRHDALFGDGLTIFDSVTVSQEEGERRLDVCDPRFEDQEISFTHGLGRIDPVRLGNLPNNGRLTSHVISPGETKLLRFRDVDAMLRVVHESLEELVV